MKHKLKKLDKRHTGYPDWEFYIQKPYNSSFYNALFSKNVEDDPRIIFQNWRAWCWETWGPSKDLAEYHNDDLFDGVGSSNPHWCWMWDRKRLPRIYFKTSADATLFALKWL